MKKTFTLVSTLILGSALALGACGKDKKPAAAAPSAEPAEPTKTEPAQDPAAAAPKADAPKSGW